MPMDRRMRAVRSPATADRPDAPHDTPLPLGEAVDTPVAVLTPENQTPVEPVPAPTPEPDPDAPTPGDAPAVAKVPAKPRRKATPRKKARPAASTAEAGEFDLAASLFT